MTKKVKRTKRQILNDFIRTVERQYLAEPHSLVHSV